MKFSRFCCLATAYSYYQTLNHLSTSIFNFFQTFRSRSPSRDSLTILPNHNPFVNAFLQIFLTIYIVMNRPFTTHEISLAIKNQPTSQTGLKTGSVLLSQAVSRQVSSALESLTSVFEMGTGVTSLLLSPNARLLYLQN